MIEPNQLRLGNSVEYNIANHNETPEWVDSVIDWEDIKNCVEDNEAFNKYHRAKPLTEELLLRFGFEKNIVKNQQFLTKKIGGYYLTIHPISNITWIGSEDAPCFNFNWQKTEHVHQLQNLFYSLTNQELKLEG